MSRIGRKLIQVPAKVKVNVGAEGAVTVEGKGKPKAAVGTPPATEQPAEAAK